MVGSLYIKVVILWFLGAIASPVLYTQSSLPHNIVTLNCTGSEETILNCSYVTGNKCTISNDANVYCQGYIV